VGAGLLGFAAGALSILSPCVLPLLPVALAGALARHRLGPLALAAGLAASATAFGLAFAVLGLALDRDLVRAVAAVLLVASGAVLLSTRLDLAFARATTPLVAGAAARFHARAPRGLGGELVVGALLGVLWTPCGGPALAGAVTLAARQESLPAAAGVMAAYSAGAALPLLALAYGSRSLVIGRQGLARLARVGQPVVGVALLLTGLLALLGADKAIETAVLDRMPAWLVDLTTRF
jgi:cytochrome c biogenesis protein CcdA